MKCDKCKEELSEEELEESHDIPCYLFEGNRRTRKQQADKFTRRYLCKFIKDKRKGCHPKYEEKMREFLINKAKEFSEEYFKEENGKSI